MGKCSTTWLLLIVLLANELAVMRCGEAESKETQAEKLCETLGIKKPAGSEASTDNSGCITSMITLLDWKEFHTIKQIIHAFTKPNDGSVSEIERAKTIFTSKSWNDPFCISQMSHLLKTVKVQAILFNKYVKPTPLPDLFVLLEKAVSMTEDWWKPHLENKDNYLPLSIIFDKIVEDQTSFKTFEIYSAWIKTDTNKRCDELNLREILKFASSQTNKFDGTAFNAIFNIVCVDNEDNKSKVWRHDTLGLVLDQPEMKAADLEFVKLVLENCAGIVSELTAAKAVELNMDWTLHKIIENLRTLPAAGSLETKLPTNDVLQQLVKAHIGAFKLKISMAQFDEQTDKAKQKGLGMTIFWHYIDFLAERQPLQILFSKDNCSPSEFETVILLIGELEKDYGEGRVMGPFLEVCTAEGLSVEFMISLLDKLKENTKSCPAQALVPFITFVCDSESINCKGGSYHHHRITYALNMFIKMNIMDANLLREIVDKIKTNELKRDAVHAVLICDDQSVKTDKCLTGLKSYFTNFSIKFCSVELIKSAISSAIKGGWENNTENFVKLYGKICEESQYEEDIVHTIESRTFDETYKAVEEFINKKKN